MGCWKAIPLPYAPVPQAEVDHPALGPGGRRPLPRLGRSRPLAAGARARNRLDTLGPGPGPAAVHDSRVLILSEGFG